MCASGPVVTSTAPNTGFPRSVEPLFLTNIIYHFSEKFYIYYLQMSQTATLTVEISFPFSDTGSISASIFSDCMFSSNSFRDLAIAFAFNHSIPRVNGTAAHTVASERSNVLLIAVFQIDRRVFNAVAEVATSDKLAAPAARTVATDIAGSCLGTSLTKVLIVIVCPAAMAMALTSS